jgi:hypothetical protein
MLQILILQWELQYLLVLHNSNSSTVTTIGTTLAVLAKSQKCQIKQSASRICIVLLCTVVGLRNCTDLWIRMQLKMTQKVTNLRD